MSDLNMQLTRKQQEILLRGLRYVRSSVALDTQEFSEEVQRRREQEYASLADIESLLNRATIVETASV